MTDPAKKVSFRFKPSDFYTGKITTDDCEHIADRANCLLDEYVTTLPRIVGQLKGTNILDPMTLWWSPEQVKLRGETHRARLWDIQEIKPKELRCELHQVFRYQTLPDDSVTDKLDDGFTAVCHRCGKRLVAKWEEA